MDQRSVNWPLNRRLINKQFHCSPFCHSVLNEDYWKWTVTCSLDFQSTLTNTVRATLPITQKIKSRKSNLCVIRHELLLCWPWSATCWRPSVAVFSNHFPYISVTMCVIPFSNHHPSLPLAFVIKNVGVGFRRHWIRSNVVKTYSFADLVLPDVCCFLRQWSSSSHERMLVIIGHASTLGNYTRQSSMVMQKTWLVYRFLILWKSECQWFYVLRQHS